MLAPCESTQLSQLTQSEVTAPCGPAQSPGSITQKLGVNNPRLSISTELLQKGEMAQMSIALSSGNLRFITSTLRKIPVLRSLCTLLLLQDVDTQCHLVSRKSQLCRKGVESLVSLDWNALLLELANIAPDLIDVVITAAVPAEREKVNKCKTGDRRIPPVGMALAILLHERSSVSNVIQNVLSLLMVDGACSKRTFERFNHLGLCLSPTGTQNLLDGMSSFQSTEIVKLIRERHIFRMVGDNFDLLIKVRQMLLDHHNKSHHWFNLLFIFSRVSSVHLPNNAPLQTLSEFPIEQYFLDDEERESTMKDYTVLVSRILCDHLSFLAPFKSVLVRHIPHEYSEEMSQKSHVLVSGTVFKDEKKK